MGVYIFRCLGFIKIGHYCKTNPWSRVAHRLFRSCACPADLKGKITLEKLELIGWFPTLHMRDEKRVHKLMKPFRAKGEWYFARGLLSAQKILHSLGPSKPVLTQDKRAAIATRRRL